MMTMERFSEEMKTKMQEKMGEGYKVTIQKVPKNNGVILTGLLVNDPGKNVAPTIYLDDLYKEMESGNCSFDDAFRTVERSVRKGMPTEMISMDFFMNYDKVKDKIFYRVVNAEANREMLKDVPHELRHDLALIFCYDFYNDEIGGGSILIRNEHMERWGITEKELMDVARVNTPRIYPPQCIKMEDMLYLLMKHQKAENVTYPSTPFEEMAVPMYVLTNASRTHGASVMMYDDYLDKVAELVKSDFYILSCSVHELIICPKIENDDEEHLHGVLLEANETVIDPQEFLTNSLYAYSRETHSLSICRSGGISEMLSKKIAAQGGMEVCQTDPNQGSGQVMEMSM